MTSCVQLSLFDYADRASRVAAIRDLLEHPRHQVGAKDRKWLKTELREERRGSRDQNPSQGMEK
mgnify:CR=1 FL=1